MVKINLILALLVFQSLFSLAVSVSPSNGDTLNWDDYSHLAEGDLLSITLPDAASSVNLHSLLGFQVRANIECNGLLRLTNDKGSLEVWGEVQAAGITLESPKIILHKDSLINTSSDNGGGSVYLGGGSQGEDPNIQNANTLLIEPGALINASALVDGPGGRIVLWSEKMTSFQGEILALGKGSGAGGNAEISSAHYLVFDGVVDLSAENGDGGELTFDPVSITIQAANPDIDGNGTNFDITSTTELDDATTTPVGFPNASSIITAGALSSLLTNNVSMTLAAQNFITVNAAIAPAGTNVTLTFEAPTVNLNSPITLASGGTLVGVGVNQVNVGPSGEPQNGVDLAANGASVNLASATYLGPLNIVSKNITLQGQGASSTILQGPPGGVPLHSGRNPVLYVTGGTNVVVSDLTVDANFVGFAINLNVTGIFYLNAGGTIQNCHITKAGNSPPPYGGGQQGNCIRADSGTGGPFTLNILGNTIDFFQKAGIVARGAVLNVNIADNIISGTGVPETPSAIGIQVSNGAAGSVTGNVITGIQFTNHAVADGILAILSGPVTISGNTVSDCDEGILASDTATSLIISNNSVSNSGDSGIVVLDTSGPTQIIGNTLTNNGGLSGGSGVNTSIYLFSQTLETFLVSDTTITPAPGTSGIITEGAGVGQAPDVDLDENTFIDP